MMELPAGYASRWIMVGGFRVHYLDGGQGPPLVLVHGAGGGAFNWIHNLEPLADYFRVLAPDLIGFGLSDKPNPVAREVIPFLGCFLGDFIEAVGLERAHLVGQSLGGGIVLFLALERPGLVDRLVVVDGAALGREVHLWFRLASLPLLNPLLTRPNRQALEWFWKNQLLSDASTLSEELIDYNYQMSIQPGAVRALRQGLRYGASWRGQRLVLLPRLHELECPTLIIWGAEDKIIPLAHARAAHRLIGEGRLYLFEHCGHIPPIERPDEFNRVLTEFLREGSTKEG